MKRICTILVLIQLLGILTSAKADVSEYKKIVDFKVETAHYVFRHYHNWSKNTREKRLKMFLGNANPFTGENDYAFIECLDKKTRKVVFKQPTPALTHLIISPNEQFVVGVSDIKALNPYHLVVFNLKGQLIKKVAITDEVVPNYSETVTNYIHWYNKKQPDFKILTDSNKQYQGLSFKDNISKPMVIN